MDEIKIQTGWCDELCMQSKRCILILQETISMLASMHTDVQTLDDGTFHSLLKLENRIDQTKQRAERVESFLQSGISTYEQLERSLTMQAQQLNGALLSDSSQSPWAHMFDNTAGTKIKE